MNRRFLKSDKVKHVIVVGSSRGLGAELVKESIKNGFNVIGIARTAFQDIPDHQSWLNSGQYKYIQLDIANSDSVGVLQNICSEFGNDLICVIFNVACIKPEVNYDKTINFDIAQDINNTGTNGLINTLKSFEFHLLNHGGIFMGISSFSAFTPPVSDLKVFYPASKAYLNMVLRCLNLYWKNKVKVVTVNLGHVGKSKKTNLFKQPDYDVVAKKIISHILNNKNSDEINYPVLYCLIYKYILRFIPDNLYFYLFTKIINPLKMRKDL